MRTENPNPNKRNVRSFNSETGKVAALRSAEKRRQRAEEKRQAEAERAPYSGNVLPLIPPENRDALGRFKPGYVSNPGGRATSLGKRVRERISPDELFDFHYAILRRDREGLERFGIPVSEVTALLQRDSAQYLSDRGWGKPHQTASVENVQTEVPADVTEAELRERWAVLEAKVGPQLGNGAA